MQRVNQRVHAVMCILGKKGADGWARNLDRL